MKTNQYWILVTENEYAETDHMFRSRKIWPRAANEVGEGLICIYIECTQEEWNDFLRDFTEKNR